MEMESYVFENQSQWTGRNQTPMQQSINEALANQRYRPGQFPTPITPTPQFNVAPPRTQLPQELPSQPGLMQRGVNAINELGARHIPGLTTEATQVAAQGSRIARIGSHILGPAGEVLSVVESGTQAVNMTREQYERYDPAALESIDAAYQHGALAGGLYEAARGQRAVARQNYENLMTESTQGSGFRRYVQLENMNPITMLTNVGGLLGLHSDPDPTPDQLRTEREARSYEDLLNRRIQEAQRQYDIKRFSEEFERLDDFTKLEALNHLDSVGMGIEAAAIIAAADQGIPKPPPMRISNTQIKKNIEQQKGPQQKGPLRKPGAPTTYPPGYLDPTTLENGATANFDPKQRVWKAKFPDGQIYVYGAGGSWTPVNSTLKPITTRGPLPPRPQRNAPVVKLGPANKLMWPMTQRGIAELWNDHTPKSRYNMMMGDPAGNPFQGISADPSHEWLDENGNRLGKIRGAGQRPPQKNTGKKPITRKLPGSGARPMPKGSVFGVLPIDPLSLGGEMFGAREGIGTSTSTFGQFWNDVKANINDALKSGGGMWDPTWYPGKNEDEPAYYRKGFVPNFSIFKDDHEMSGRAGYLSTKSMTINNGGELQRINNRETIVPMGKQAAIIPPHGPWKAVRENQIKGRMYEGYMPNFAGEEILNQSLERINNNRLNTQPVVQQAAQAPATASVPDPAAWGAAAGAAMAEQAGPVIASQLEGVTMQTEGTQTIEMRGGFDIGGSALPAEAVESLQQNMLAALGGATEQIMSAMGASPEAMQKGSPRLGGISPRFN